MSQRHPGARRRAKKKDHDPDDVFIAKTLIERTGAQLTLTNAVPPRRGAVARVDWSRAQFEADG